MNFEAPDRPPLDHPRLGELRAVGAVTPQVEVVDEAASTNALVADRARNGAAEGLVVVAEHQTSGRGRLDRVWHTPARSAITVSVLLRPELPAPAWPWLPLLTGTAVATTLRSHDIDAGLKWPNDVLVGDRKICGILVERIETPTGPAAVVGIGLNAGLTTPELPVGTATSLAIETGEQPDRTEVLADLLDTLLTAYADWRVGSEESRSRLVAAYTARCVTLHRRVRVDLPGGEELVGEAVAIDADGRLVVVGPRGPRPVGAGDVVHVRPTDAQ